MATEHRGLVYCVRVPRAPERDVGFVHLQLSCKKMVGKSGFDKGFEDWSMTCIEFLVIFKHEFMSDHKIWKKKKFNDLVQGSLSIAD